MCAGYAENNELFLVRDAVSGEGPWQGEGWGEEVRGEGWSPSFLDDAVR